MPDLIELLFGEEVAWHLKRIAKAEKRIKRLKRLLPASAGPTETQAIQDAIKSAEAAVKWDQDQLKKLLKPKRPVSS
jgi:protein subunit release factor A